MSENAPKRLKDFLPQTPFKAGEGAETLLDAFMAWAESRGTMLFPSQEEAILELLDGKNVILNTPTGSGKSMVALALHFDSLAHGRRSVYN